MIFKIDKFKYYLKYFFYYCILIHSQKLKYYYLIE